MRTSKSLSFFRELEVTKSPIKKRSLHNARKLPGQGAVPGHIWLQRSDRIRVLVWTEDGKFFPFQVFLLGTEGNSTAVSWYRI